MQGRTTLQCLTTTTYPPTSQLLLSLWEVAEHFSSQPTVAAGFNRLLHAQAEFNKYQANVVDQAARTISKNFTTMLKT